MVESIPSTWFAAGPAPKAVDGVAALARASVADGSGTRREGWTGKDGMSHQPRAEAAAYGMKALRGNLTVAGAWARRHGGLRSRRVGAKHFALDPGRDDLPKRMNDEDQAAQPKILFLSATST